MAFKPEPMQRTIVVSSKGNQKAIIETLHLMRIAHLNDFVEEREGEMAGFRIGRPLTEASAASEIVVRLRALVRNLSLEGHAPAKKVTIAQIEDGLASTLPSIEREIGSSAEARVRITAALDALKDEEARIGPLRALPLDIEDYGGYGALAVFAGTTAQPFDEELRAVVPDYALFPGENNFFALFVPKAREAAASDVLFKSGYREHALPAGRGSPSERLAAIERERATLTAELERTESALASLRERHGDFIVAAEEHLTIEVAKAEAPLSFATTQNAFVVDAWLPASEAARVEAALVRATGGSVHVETVEHHAYGMHGMDDAFGGATAGDEAHHAQDEHQPPTKFRHGGFSKQFGFLTEMFSVPKYNELDPTAVLAIAFPLFFGFMIGDLGLGLVMAGLGYLMFKKLGHVPEMKGLGFAILVAGGVAAAFGGLVFMDAFGIPLGVNHHMEEELAHQGIAHFSCSPDVYRALGETTWSCLLGGQTWHAEPLIYKIFDVQTMLLISIFAAFVHLFIGLIFGVKNEIGHSVKHTAAKFGWMILLILFFPAAFALLAADTWTAWTGLGASTAYMGAAVGLVVGGIILGWSEGIAGVIEIPSMFSNLLSYLRLGAVAIAKGAMAVAFNKMTLVDMALLEGGFMVVVGFIAFVVVQALLFVLGVLSSGIQAIRLNYVEFFTKFYKGGGEKFTPFGHVRRYTLPANAPTVGGGKL